MHPHAELLTRFYTAFQARDHEGMAACYHPEASFTDPVFPGLKGPEVGGMWKMLCIRGKDLKLEFSGIEADDNGGRAHWEAWYTFSATGRKVHNIIDGEFTFKDGLIHTHQDNFDLWRWSGMALGLPGKLLGWTPIIKNKIRGQAGAGLKAFMAKDSGEA